jgi:hypothetical protein
MPTALTETSRPVVTGSPGTAASSPAASTDSSISMQSQQNYQAESDFLKKYLAKSIRNYYWSSKAWSFVYHGCIFSASILSALSAILQYNKAADYGWLAPTLAAIASLLGIISVSGNFPAKWRANRLTKAALEALEIRLSSSTCELAKVREELEDIITRHAKAIVSEPDSPRKG